METSMRIGSDDGDLYLHAKENFVTNNNVVLQFHGRLNTASFKPGGTVHLQKVFRPEPLTGLTVGARLEVETRDLTCGLQAKKSVMLTESGLLTLDLKGGYDHHVNSGCGEASGCVELSQKVFNFTEHQDLKVKLGCNLATKRPYMQLRENNWTLNAEFRSSPKDVMWSLAYDL